MALQSVYNDAPLTELHEIFILVGPVADADGLPGAVGTELSVLTDLDEE